jgi:predicted GIY-YIG superfamily endonuclease
MNSGEKSCALCGRIEARLTRHHLIPRTRHHNKKTKQSSTRKEREHTVLFCSSCHKQVHALFTEKELEREYDTVEKIATHPEISRFVEWMRRQPPGKHVTVRPPRERR